MNNIIVAPSILSADFANLQRDIEIITENGADWVHVDVMDGHFVPNITIGVPVVKSIKPISNIPLDVHLMIENPDKYLDAFAQAGADIITVHYETVKDNINDVINLIKKHNIKAGVSIKPNTPAEVLEEIIKEIDLILVMTVEPGFGGQKFIDDCLNKISYIKNLSKTSNPDLIIEVDGGINKETAYKSIKAGANALVAGTYIFKANNIYEAIESLKNF